MADAGIRDSLRNYFLKVRFLLPVRYALVVDAGIHNGFKHRLSQVRVLSGVHKEVRQIMVCCACLLNKSM